MPDDWLTLEEAANYLGLAAHTIRRLAGEGALGQAERWALRVRRSTIDEYIRSHRIQSGELSHLLNP